MVESAADRAVFVGTGDWGAAATYTPSGGSPVALNVLLDQPHEDAGLGAAGVLQVAYTARIRADDVAAPAADAALVVGLLNFTVRAVRQDAIAGMFTLDLELD